MVGHEVEHQLVVAAQGRNVEPVPKAGVDLAVVDHGEPVVGCVGEHRQDVDVGDGVADLAVQDAAQGGQRRLPLAADCVAIGNEDGRVLAGPGGGSDPSQLGDVAVGELEQLDAGRLMRLWVHQFQQRSNHGLELGTIHGAPRCSGS